MASHNTYASISAGSVLHRNTYRLTFTLLFSILLIGNNFSQTHVFTWVSGSDTINQWGRYSDSPIPGARREAVSWTDSLGYLWLHGGYGYDKNGRRGYLNDLWKYDINSDTWIWISGSDEAFEYSLTIPRARIGAISWTDLNGNFWLHGGLGVLSELPPPGGLDDYINDLWKYYPSTGEWICLHDVYPFSSSYGELKVPDEENTPGGRYIAVSWTDNSGNLWLFGGNYNWMLLRNDLWKYDPVIGQWTWMSGSNEFDQPGYYGELKIPSDITTPGARWYAAAWRDDLGNFWLFGGDGYDEDELNAEEHMFGGLNDLWKYDPSSEQWTWMGGSKAMGQYGNCIGKGIPSVDNMPGTMSGALSWVDASGKFWLYGSDGRLWKYNPNTEEWTWVAGSGNSSQPGVYNSQSSEPNIPGVRSNAVTWTDKLGNLWLFGGSGLDKNGEGGLLNDLWMYNPDTTSPYANITCNENNPTNNSPLNIIVSFNEEVSDFNKNDLIITNGTLGTVSTNNMIIYEVPLIPTTDGQVTIYLPSGVVYDASGNRNTESSTLSTVYDSTAPTVIISSNFNDPTNASPIYITIIFSEKVSGFDHTDLIVTNGTTGTELTSDLITYIVPITPFTDGDIVVSLPAEIATDMAGNGNVEASDFTISYDSTSPTAEISSTESELTNMTPFIVEVSFSEAVTGFVHTDLDVVNGTAGTATTNDNISYSVPITPISDGLVTVDLSAGKCSDTAGNSNLEADEFSINYDGTPPSVIISCNESNPTNNTQFDITVTFSEEVEDFDNSDITVTNGTTGTATSSDNISFIIPITPIEEGIVTVSVDAAIAYDQAGNGNLEAEDFTITYELPNNAPEIADQLFAVDENSENGTVVGTILATDEDGDDLTFTIEEGNVNNAFAIDGTTGEITVNSTTELDYETNPVFVLTVKINDGNGGTATATVTINLNDLDETSITGIDDEPGSAGIILYPNPFSDEFIIESKLLMTKNFKLSLYNPVGQKIPFIFTNMGDGVIQITLLSNDLGMYFLVVLINEETHILNLVKR